jgi:phospholipid/cholesterol/gamma-HCH transport system substrate-binding protein
MEFKVNYTLVGLFVIVLGAAFISIALWMTSASRKQYDTYLVYMNEAVSGLNVQAPAKFNGVDVGKVADISLNPDNPQQVRLELKIIHGTPITQTTHASLMAQGITGLTYIGLKAQTPHAPLLTQTPGSPYPIIPSAPSLLVELDTALREAVNNLRHISHTFQETFNPQNQKAIAQSLQNIAKFTDTLAKNSGNISDTLKSSKEFLHSASLTSQRLNELSKELQTTVKAGNLTMQTVSQQALPNAMQIMQQLSQILGNVQQISNELPNNPSMLLRGKTVPPLGPGES